MAWRMARHGGTGSQKTEKSNEFRKEVNNIHIHLIEFSLLGETILEWDDEDLGLYMLGV